MSLSLERSSEIAGGNAGSPTFWEATASFLRVAIVVTWVGVPVYGMVHYLQSPDPWTRIVMSSLLMVIGAVSWICLAHHKIKAAILIFGIGIWMGLIALAIMFGGVTSTPMVLFPLMVMLAGWWCSAKAACRFGSYQPATLKVGIDHAVPVFFGLIEQSTGDCDTCVIDHDIARTNLIETRFYAVARTDIHTHERCFASL